MLGIVGLLVYQQIDNLFFNVILPYIVINFH